jgi:hypothetical protein
MTVTDCQYVKTNACEHSFRPRIHERTPHRRVRCRAMGWESRLSPSKVETECPPTLAPTFRSGLDAERTKPGLELDRSYTLYFRSCFSGCLPCGQHVKKLGVGRDKQTLRCPNGHAPFGHLDAQATEGINRLASPVDQSSGARRDSHRSAHNGVGANDVCSDTERIEPCRLYSKPIEGVGGRRDLDNNARKGHVNVVLTI